MKNVALKGRTKRKYRNGSIALSNLRSSDLQHKGREPGEVEGVLQHIEQQEAHHQTTSFQGAYRRFLEHYDVKM